jgi:hypothetical protein
MGGSIDTLPLYFISMGDMWTPNDFSNVVVFKYNKELRI